MLLQDMFMEEDLYLRVTPDVFDYSGSNSRFTYGLMINQSIGKSTSALDKS